MKKTLLTLSLLLLLFAGFTTVKDLPACEGEWTSWTNCFGSTEKQAGAQVNFTYVGEWKDGQRNGKGTVTWSNGDKYVGEFKDGKIHGRGTYTWANGDKYVGEWQGDKKHDRGTFTWTDGDKYVGRFQDDKKHGKGIYTWADRSKYVGEFKDGKQHGRGTYSTANGDKYVGEWQGDKKHGRGTYSTANGDKYVGEWQDNKQHGRGTYSTANGDKYVGEWKDDKGNGGAKYTFSDGSYYKGQFFDGAFNGKGTCYAPGQAAEPCEFKNGEDITKGGSVFAGGVWGDEEEGLSRQDIRFLNSIDRMDKKNEALGESIPFETRVKIIESMEDALQEGLSISSGLAIIDASSKGTEITAICRANIDISNYRKEEIRDLQELLLNRFKQATCSAPLNRALIFVLDLSNKYEFVDFRNRPFGGKMEFNKADCKGIKTIGRPMIYPKALLKVIVEEANS